MQGRNFAAVALLGLATLLLMGGSQAAERGTPGLFDYYALVLGWSPTYCRNEGNGRDARQCSSAKPYGFLLHGLWPQYAKGWPEDCDIGKRPWVPQSVIDGMRDIMPDKGLVIHEYRAHGTCSGLSPAAYFALARELYAKVKVPDLFADPAAKEVSPEAIEQAFAAANPWLTPETMAVTCRDGNLLDVRICFGRDLAARPCGVNEDEARLCPLSEITVPPRNTLGAGNP